MSQLKLPRLPLVEGTADLVLRELGIHKLPISPTEIAEIKGIVVQPKPPENDGFSGLLARVGNTFGIMYATYVESEGFQRFSIAHELGHYFLPGHVDQLLKDGAHQSHANFASADPYELEADLFAAALLMPERLFRQEMGRRDDNLETVRALAEICGTSLTATAIRFARLTRGAVAVVQSTNGIVDFCSFSEQMKDAKVRWLSKGMAVPVGSLTHDFGRSAGKVASALSATAETDLSDWFDCPASHLVAEEVIGLGRYGKVLTLIVSEKISKEADPDNDEPTDDELEESWTPRFRR